MNLKSETYIQKALDIEYKILKVLIHIHHETHKIQTLDFVSFLDY